MVLDTFGCEIVPHPVGSERMVVDSSFTHELNTPANSGLIQSQYLASIHSP